MTPSKIRQISPKSPRLRPGWPKFRRVGPLAPSIAFLAASVAGPTGAEITIRDSSDVIEEVVVTGTWIPGTPEDDPLPVTQITRDDLRAEGSPSIMELLRNLSLSQGADGESDQYGTRTGADRASANLRGLGPSRSLVLLNSRRMTWSPGSIPDQAQLFVDVNLLPGAALERIEVLRDGAAATYGSDAIAGVLNFITRSNFNGIEVEARHKAVAGSNGDDRLAIVAGTDFGGGAGGIVSSIGVQRRSPMPMVERDWAVRPYAENPRGGWSGTGTPGLFVPLAAFAQTAGNASAMRAVGIVDPNCERVGGAHTNVPTARAQGGVCRFQYTPLVNLVQETLRWQWFTEGHRNFDNGMRVSGELLVARTEVPNWMTSPSYPPSDVIDLSRLIQAGNPALVDMAAKYPDLYGEYAHCDAEYCRWRGDGGVQDAAGVPAAWQNVAWINGRHFGQGGPLRGHPRDSATERVVVEAEGDWGAASWNAALTYARARRLEEDGDGLHYRHVRAHLGLAGFDCEALVPNRYDRDGRLDFPWQTLRDHAGQGPCRYWVPFSNAIDPHPQVPGASNPDYAPAFEQKDLIDYMVTSRGFEGDSSLLALEAVLHGDTPWHIADLPVEYAVGAQVRREQYGRQEYSAETGSRGAALHDLDLYPCRGGPTITDCVSGRTGVFIYLPPAYDAEANRDIYAVFGETALWLTERLNAQLSLRYEYYHLQGLNSIDPKLALRWQVLPSLTVRASTGTTFRAPTINQIEPGIATTSRQFIGRIGTFKPIRALGNPMLEPETAATYNVGAILDREGWLTSGDRLFVSADLWHYAFEKPLVLEPYLRVLDLACPPGQPLCATDSPYFEQIQFGGKTAVSDISAISVSVVNGPDLNTGGVDLKAEYSAPTGRGEWTVGIAGTRTLSWEIDGWKFGDAYDAIGRLNYDTPLARTVVDWKGHAWLGAELGGTRLRWTVHYIDGYRHDGDSEPAIDAHVSHDLVATWTAANDRLTLDIAILNAADRDPPRVLRQLNYDPVTHNPLGRTVEVGVRWRP